MKNCSFVKIQKKNFFFWGGGSGSGWGGGRGGCDRRIEVLGKIDQKKFRAGGGGAGGVRWGVGLMGVRVDVNEELQFFVKIQKNKIFWGGRGGGLGRGGGWGSGWGGQGGSERRIEVFGKIHKNKIGGSGGEGSGGGSVLWGGGGVRVDVNAMLGVGGDVGYG